MPQTMARAPLAPCDLKHRICALHPGVGCASCRGEAFSRLDGVDDNVMRSLQCAPLADVLMAGVIMMALRVFKHAERQYHPNLSVATRDSLSMHSYEFLMRCYTTLNDPAAFRSLDVRELVEVAS